MSNLIVITFDNEDEAGKVRESVRQLQRNDLITLDDSAVVVKDGNGKVQVQNEIDRGVRIGAIGGGLLGLMLGFIFFPLSGLIMGALGGALVGRMTDLGVDPKFVKDVQEAMPPGSSAIFLIVRQAEPNAALTALKPYKGTVYHTSLSTQGEESLRRVLRERQGGERNE
ncbi:MAG: DUF1269 domain-containing protein [Caldilineaceae bacterium]|nr:DUF1269 domain-containing protein [Caldilineaceae bacterium]